MKLEEAIVYCLATSHHGMTTDKIAEMINSKRLVVNRNGAKVSSSQVYAVIMRYPSTFCKAEGRIMLLM